MSRHKLVETENGILTACQITMEGMGTINTAFAVLADCFMLGISTTDYPHNKDVRVYFDVDDIRFLRDALTRMINEPAPGTEEVE